MCDVATSLFVLSTLHSVECALPDAKDDVFFGYTLSPLCVLYLNSTSSSGVCHMRIYNQVNFKCKIDSQKFSAETYRTERCTPSHRKLMDERLSLFTFNGLSFVIKFSKLLYTFPYTHTHNKLVTFSIISLSFTVR